MTAPDRIWAVFEPRPNKNDPPWVYAAAEETRGTEYVRADLMQELIDAYKDIMDYGIVFAKKEQQDRLKAAKEKVNDRI